MEKQRDITIDERLRILDIAGKTFVGQESFEDYLGKLTQYVIDGIHKQVYIFKTETEDDRTELNEG